MLCTKKPKVCDGRGECFRRYTKYYYYKHDNVICTHNCELIHCSGCKLVFPKWHYDLFSSGKCYDCNKVAYESEVDSAEEDLRSDASLDSGDTISSEDEDTKNILSHFRGYSQQHEQDQDERTKKED